MIEGMGHALRKDVSLAEFLSWEGLPDERYELIDGEIVAMTGASLGHSRVVARLVRLIDRHVEGTPCEVLFETMLVEIDSSSAFAPDVLVTCQRIQPDSSQLSDPPVVVIEVLSPTTRHKDRGVKLAGYCRLGSLQQYVLVDPAARTVESHSRQTDGAWLASDHTASGFLPLSAIDLELKLSDIFAPLDER